MMPFACPMVTRWPLDWLDSRSKPRPPFRTSQGTIGRPRSSSCRSEPAFGLFGGWRTSRARGCRRVRPAPGEPTREATSRRAVLPHEPVAVPAPVGAGEPGLTVDDRLPAAHAVELAGQRVVAELAAAVGTAQRVEVDELPTVRAPGLGDHPLTAGGWPTSRPAAEPRTSPSRSRCRWPPPSSPRRPRSLPGHRAAGASSPSPFPTERQQALGGDGGQDADHCHRQPRSMFLGQDHRRIPFCRHLSVSILTGLPE